MTVVVEMRLLGNLLRVSGMIWREIFPRTKSLVST
jgi:hypothetical protein